MASNEALRFPNWEEALAKASLGHEHVLYKQTIIGFLHHCKVSRAPATIMLAKAYIERLEKQGNKREETTREARRWFVRTARKGNQAAGATTQLPQAVSKGDHAPTAADDLGGADWERDLIRAVREKRRVWRTERTYRERAARFARSLSLPSP